MSTASMCNHHFPRSARVLTANRVRYWLVGLLVLGYASVAHAAFELSGYLRANNVARFVVVDLESGEQSPWLFIGDQFRGFMVMRFDAAEEVLMMEQRDGTAVRLPLASYRAKTEVQVTIRPDGRIYMDGRQTNVGALGTMVKDLSGSGKAVSIVVRTQPGESIDAFNDITTMLRESGAKKWSLRLIDVTAEKNR